MSSTWPGSERNEPRPPIHLSTESLPHGVRVQVIGAASATYEASFHLEVTSEGNRSVHRGSARLEGGEPVILSSVTLGSEGTRPWRAHLRVEPRGHSAYEQTEASH